MVQLGMDVEAVENAGRQLKQTASSVDAIVGTLDKTVSGLSSLWDGPDAQRLMQSWPTFRKSLLAAQASVAGLGQSALNNASEQREASAAKGPGEANGGGSHPPATPAGPPPAAEHGVLGATSGSISQPAVSQDAYDHRHGAALTAPEGWCTSWVQFRRDQLGLPVPHGQGGAMAGSLASQSTSPSLGAVGSWGPGTAKDAGHTFVVEGISDGNPRSVTISEMNSGSGPHPWQDKAEGITNNFDKVTTQVYTEVPPAGSGKWRDGNYPNTIHTGVTFGQ